MTPPPLLPKYCFLNISLSPERLTVKFITLDAGALSIAAMPKGCAADLFTSKNQKLFSKKRSIQRSIAVIENRQIRNRKSCLHITQIENTRCSDTHITILPEFVMPAGREAEFKAGFSKFYDATKVDFPLCTKFSGFDEFSKIYYI